MTESTQAPKDLIGFLDYYFVKKAPVQIPAVGREWIVKWGPWIALVLLVLRLPAILLLLGIEGSMFPSYRYGYIYAPGFSYWPWVLGVVVHFVLMALALPGLFARKMSGWTLMFYAQAVGAIAALISGTPVGGLIVALIAFYIMFQVRSLYK